jgi:hypothetical protein
MGGGSVFFLGGETLPNFDFDLCKGFSIEKMAQICQISIIIIITQIAKFF